MFPPLNMQSSNSEDQSDTPMELASPLQTIDSQNSSEPLHSTTSKSPAKMNPSDKGGQGILPMETDPDSDQVLSFIASSKMSGPKEVWIKNLVNLVDKKFDQNAIMRGKRRFCNNYKIAFKCRNKSKNRSAKMAHIEEVIREMDGLKLLNPIQRPSPVSPCNTLVSPTPDPHNEPESNSQSHRPDPPEAPQSK